jgi:hypothetical protein
VSISVGHYGTAATTWLSVIVHKQTIETAGNQRQRNASRNPPAK